jgi:hypothetical protein
MEDGLNALSSATTTSSALASVAAQALQSADRTNTSVADRQVRQPDTWLLRRCYLVLAEHSSADATFSVVELIRDRDPLASYRVLPILARRACDDVGLAFTLSNRVALLRLLLQHPIAGDTAIWGEGLLSLACAAARLDDDTLAFACLERLDQAPGIWLSFFSQPDRRELLAETIALVGLHPLTTHLIRQAIRWHGEAGAQFLQQVAVGAAGWIKAGRQLRRSRRLLQRCVETIQNATLTSLLSRRYAASILALGGDANAILEQVTTIANIQEARRESGVAFREAEQKVLRQVKRPRADADVDFQFYTLRDAVDCLDLAALDANHRAMLAERLASLGVGSDGWTAAAATAALIRLDETDHAIAVVDQIDAHDPTRSEAYCVLVDGLLSVGDTENARIQTQKAIRWAQSLAEHHPERLTIWGLATAYLSHGQAQAALKILSQRRSPPLLVRLRRWLGEVPSEETLREETLRMHAALLGGEGGRDVAVPILATIRHQAPEVLDGKPLALFYTDHVLMPLLKTEHHDLAWSFLHDIQAVLGRILSREQPARVESVAQILIDELARLAEDGQDHRLLERARTAATDLLIYLWEGSAKQGIWSTVYSIGGSLSLVVTLAGPEAVVEIAHFIASEGQSWRKPTVGDEYEAEMEDESRVTVP